MELVEQATCPDNDGENDEILAADFKPAVEALLFATDEPLSVTRIRDIFGGNTDKDEINQVIGELKDEYNSSPRGFCLEEVADGYQILTKVEYHHWVSKLLKKKKEYKISNACLETLSIIAYKQPILRVDVESIRGVQSGQMIRTLVDMGLVKVSGRSELLGRPLMYSTTKKFLQNFGLKSIKDLPSPDGKLEGKDKCLDEE